jgi:twinkle protein
MNNLKEQVKRKLLTDVEAVCRKLLPNGKRLGGKWIVGNILGDAGKSMSVELSGEKAGLWFDAAEGHGGDILSLWAQAKSLTFTEALQESAHFVGITNIQTFESAKPKGYPKKDLRSATGTPLIEHFLSRGLKESVLQEYRIRAHDRKSPHNEHFIAYQYITPCGKPAFLKSTGIHRTKDGKKDTVLSKDSWITLWGWWTVKPHHTQVCITEGEEDAMSLRQMLGLNDIPVLSLPNGTQGLSFIEHDFTALQQFDRINLFLDCDGAGEGGAKELANRLGRSRCFRVKLPDGCKDANEVLTRNPEKEHTPLAWIDVAKTYDPPSLVSSKSTVAAAIERNNERIASGMKKDFVLPVKFRLCDGDTTILQGYPGHGKTDFGNYMMLNEIANGHKVCIIAADTDKEDIQILFAWQVFGEDPTNAMIEQTFKHIGDKIYFINGVDIPVTTDSVLNDMEYCAARYGVTRFLIDNLHEMEDIAKDDYNKQDKFVRSLDKFDKKWKTHTVLVAHSVFSDSSETRIPRKNGVEGSKGMVKPVQNVITIFRNKVLENPAEYEDGDKTPKRVKMLLDGSNTYFDVSKQRKGFREEFTCAVHFDKDSRRYSMPFIRAKPIIEIPVPKKYLIEDEQEESPF